ncbi:hypothetical protein QR685DRAFT_348128 [Neurospora intermedia]|uniref:Uncharacterized protein n=1 Tax=Neurospora intermedia TaxID=5142 RepID=A0ABR3D538_NEUIN
MRPQRPSFLGFHDPASGNPPTVTASTSDLAAQRHFQRLQQPQGGSTVTTVGPGCFHGAPSASRQLGNPGPCIPHGDYTSSIRMYAVHMSL